MSATRDRYAARFTLLAALRWFPVGLMVPVLILLMQARGLDLAQAGRLMAVYGVVALVLELPTGGLADVIGRRPVLAGAAVLSAAGAAALALSTSVPLMVGAVAALGAGRALASGPLEAWYVDAVRRNDPQADIRTGIGRAQAAEGLALAVGSAIGGILPALMVRAGLMAPAAATADTGRWLLPLSVPLLAAAVMLVVQAVAVLLLATEPRERGSGRRRAGPGRRQGARGTAAGSLVEGGSPGAGTAEGGSREGVGAEGGDGAGARTIRGTVRAGVTVVLHGRGLRRLVGYSALLGVALSGVELTSPAAFSALLGGPERAGGAYGLLVGLGFGAAALGALLAPAAVRRVGDARRSAIGLAAASAVVVLLLAVPAAAVAGAGFLAFYLVLGVNGPILAGLLHDRVPSAQRSTVLSAESLALQLGGVVASLAVGALVAATSVASGYLVAAVALALGALLLRGLGRAAAPAITAGSAVASPG